MGRKMDTDEEEDILNDQDPIVHMDHGAPWHVEGGVSLPCAGREISQPGSMRSLEFPFNVLKNKLNQYIQTNWGRDRYFLNK
jgi:hypothetical protein